MFSSDHLESCKNIFQLMPTWFCEYRFSALTEIRSLKLETLFGIDDEIRVCWTRWSVASVRFSGVRRNFLQGGFI